MICGRYGVINLGCTKLIIVPVTGQIASRLLAVDVEVDPRFAKKICQAKVDQPLHLNSLSGPKCSLVFISDIGIRIAGPRDAVVVVQTSITALSDAEAKKLITRRYSASSPGEVENLRPLLPVMMERCGRTTDQKDQNGYAN